MKIVIYWDNEDSQKLISVTNESLDSLGLSDFITVESNSDDIYKNELNISKNFAFCVEEDSIDFKDMIFEWTIPPKEEMDSLLISLIWWENSSSCNPDSCSSCWWWC